MTLLLPTLGRPGVYLAPDLVAAPPLGVRMDVCAFVGVAPRGPAWERSSDSGYDDTLLAARRARSVPVPVESWAEYTEVFGAFEGPGMLPYSVAAFFAQGGRRAYVSRVVPANPRPTTAPVPPAVPPTTVMLPASEPYGCAGLAFDPTALTGARKGTPDLLGARDPVWLRARNEGTWGNRLTATLTFSTTAIPTLETSEGRLILTSETLLAAGDLLRLHFVGAPSALLGVVVVDRVGSRWLARLDLPVVGALLKVEVVTATLQVVDGDPDHPRQETWTELRLRSAHPRWLGNALGESRLVELAQVSDASGQASDLAAVTPMGTALTTAVAMRPPDGSGDGVDRYRLLTFDDVLGPLGVLAGSARSDGDLAPDGLDALAALVDPADSAAPAFLVVVDLYEPHAAPPTDDVGVPATIAGAEFDLCVTLPGQSSRPSVEVELPGLRLDPSVPADRVRIIGLQQQVVAAAEGLGLIALLDVPPGLRPAQVLAWRAAFNSAWAAGWHGWLRAPVGDTLVTIPPTGNAAGLIAATETAAGLATGPALVTLTGVVAVAEGPGVGAAGLDSALLGRLHRAGINVSLPTRDGVEFSAARTLANDQDWRQLTVRRVVTMVERSVASGLGWAVFEPNNQVLRDRIVTAVTGLLRMLFDVGAFAGASPGESYFVRTAPASGPGALGESDLLCEIGLAPAEPTEFVLVRVLRADDGTLRTEVSA